MSKKIKVACYCRVSTDKKEQASSLANQESFFRDYLKKSKEYELYKVYPDKGLSGTLLKRENFEEMLKDAGLDIDDYSYTYHPINSLSDQAEGKQSEVIRKEYVIIDRGRKPKFNYIFVRNTSRFARNILITDVLRKLRNKKVYVRFLDIDKSTENESDITVIQLFQTFDELFVRDLSRKVRQGNERSVANRIVRSHPKLYGYNYIKRRNLSENNQLRRKPEEARVIQIIYRLYAGCFSPTTPQESFISCDHACSTCQIQRSSGVGIRQIINYLTANDIKTRAKKNFGSTTLKNILSNEKYAGYLNTGKYDTGIIFETKTYPKVKDDYLVEPAPEYIDEIISMELFEICETIRLSRSDDLQLKGKAPSSSLYGGGFLKCSKCGANYGSNVDKGKPFYQCGRKKSKGLKACTSANVSEAAITEYINLLMSGGLTPYIYSHRQATLLDGFNAASRRLSFIRRNRDDVKVQTLQDKQAQLTRRIENLRLQLADGEGNTTIINNLISKTEVELAEIEIELDRYTKKPLQFLKEAEDLLSAIEPYLSLLEDLQANMQTTTYTIEEFISYVDFLTIYGETNPTGGGGKPAEVNIIPTLTPDTKIKSILSVEEPDLKTYFPIKVQANARIELLADDEVIITKRTLKKREADALDTDPENTKLFPLTALNSTFSVLSDELKALQTLYSC
ncbi:recombinase family protein [Clostridium faecium]|uniref:Recombinase family protein n=1 Tax=Clostridium faecium TaxID=2762223 RepID=A0ABR8YW16_9CLOT|nr:recombinase family protein [Clostridium faecium]MBD8048131.1 recombinase family protein [Clostridium faecium]